jgi:hypothetical protein
MDTQEYTLSEWRAEATRRGNGSMLDCPMRCPLCKNVATPRMFKEAGGDPERAAQECIGRLVGAQGGLHVRKKPMPQPCDWAAFGLFGSLNEGHFVVTEDGKRINVFSFADDDTARPATTAAGGEDR